MAKRKSKKAIAETPATAGLPPAVKLVCLWLFLLPALILWFVMAKQRGVHDQWAAYLPLMIVFAILATFLNKHPFWKLDHLWHIVSALAAASVLAFLMGVAGLAILQLAGG
jgi:hypothetical protein